MANLSGERIAQLGFLLVGLLMLLAVLFRAPSETVPAGAARSFSDLEPQPLSGTAPAWSLVDLAGKQRSLAEFKGRSVLLSFWATWCQSCKEELPQQARLAGILKDKPLTLVLVSVDEGWEAVNDLAGQIEQAHSAQSGVLGDTVAMLRGRKDNVIMLLDPDSRIAKAYGTVKFPETYLIDPVGSLRYKFIGPKDWGSQESVAFFRGQVR